MAGGEGYELTLYSQGRSVKTLYSQGRSVKSSRQMIFIIWLLVEDVGLSKVE